MIENNYNPLQSLNQQIIEHGITNVTLTSEAKDMVNANSTTPSNCSHDDKNDLILDLERFRLYNKGLFAWVKSKNDDAGTFKRIGNYIKAVGKTNLDGVSCLLLEFVDSNNNRIDFMLERGELADTRGLVRRLLNAGYMVDLYYQRYLQTYLNEYTPESDIIATKQIGWIGDCYVLPDRVIGDNQNIKYYGSASSDRFAPKGSLIEWRDNVANHCAGFDFLELSLYAGLSSLLINFVGFGYGLQVILPFLEQFKSIDYLRLK